MPSAVPLNTTSFLDSQADAPYGDSQGMPALIKPASNSPQLWSYRFAQDWATMSAVGYFNLLASKMRVGDFIFCKCSGTPTCVIAAVTAISGGVVTVARSMST